jgi:hypothetical protein
MAGKTLLLARLIPPSTKDMTNILGPLYKSSVTRDLVKSSGVMKALFTLKDIRVEARVPGGRPVICPQAAK